jgi:hypothetical protein
VGRSVSSIAFMASALNQDINWKKIPVFVRTAISLYFSRKRSCSSGLRYTKKVKLFQKHAVEAYRVVRC